MKPQILAEVRPSARAMAVRLLVMADSQQDVDLWLFELKEAGFRIEHTVARNRQEFQAVYAGNRFDAILSDYRLPNWTGLDALKEVRAAGDDAPFLLVTGTLGEGSAIECIKQGADDYVLKDRLSRLPVALQGAIQQRAQRKETQRTQAALAESEARVHRQFAELDLLYRTAPVSIAVMSRDLRYLRVNEALAANHQLPPADFVGKSLEEILPEAAAEATALYNRVFATGEPILNVEARIKRTYEPFEARDYLSSFYPLAAPEG